MTLLRNPYAAKLYNDLNIKDLPPPNLTLISKKTNARQGGARNCGVSKAKGDYVVYIDNDDYFAQGAFENLKRELLNNRGVDILMTDYVESRNEGKKMVPHLYSTRNSQEMLSGGDFLVTQEVPWVPWCYVYRREFLLDNGISFQENTRFEDVDYVMKATLLAKKILSRPLSVVVHCMSATQTTAIGNNVEKIHDLFWLFYRVGKVAESCPSSSLAAKNAILAHHRFGYSVQIKRLLWRVPYSKQVYILRKFPPQPTNKRILETARKHPRFLAGVLSLASPFLHTAYWVYKKVRRK